MIMIIHVDDNNNKEYHSQKMTMPQRKSHARKKLKPQNFRILRDVIDF